MTRSAINNSIMKFDLYGLTSNTVLFTQIILINKEYACKIWNIQWCTCNIYLVCFTAEVVKHKIHSKMQPVTASKIFHFSICIYLLNNKCSPFFQNPYYYTTEDCCFLFYKLNNSICLILEQMVSCFFFNQINQFIERMWTMTVIFQMLAHVSSYGFRWLLI